MLRLINFVEITRPLYAVFADEDGQPVAKQVYLAGVMEQDDEHRSRVPACFVAREHMEPADLDPAFVGYVDEWADAEKLHEKCIQRRQELKKKAAEEANSGAPKLWTPEGGKKKSIAEILGNG